MMTRAARKMSHGGTEAETDHVLPQRHRVNFLRVFVASSLIFVALVSYAPALLMVTS